MWTRHQSGHDRFISKDGVFLTLQVWRISPHTVTQFAYILSYWRYTAKLRMIRLNLSTIKTAVPEFIDPVFAKTSSKRSFSVIENERVGACFRKTRSINSGTGL
jgi:hypothetical protein